VTDGFSEEGDEDSPADGIVEGFTEVEGPPEGVGLEGSMFKKLKAPIMEEIEIIRMINTTSIMVFFFKFFTSNT
jgi:hypothetical protein